MSLTNYDTMDNTMHYRRITGYRILPPRIRILSEEPEAGTPAERYLRSVDDVLGTAAGYASQTPESSADLVAAVFGNQLQRHEVASRHLASMIQERRALAEKHLSDIQWRLDACLERRPLRRGYGGSPQQDRQVAEVERQILDLERQKRDVQLTLWRDTLELRQAVLTERQESQETQHRMRYLSGWHDEQQRETGTASDGFI